MYQRHCMTRKNEGYDVTGKSFLIGLPYLHVRIGCLFTSEFYGNRKSAADVVLRNTATSIRDLFKVIPEKSFEIHSPKINSGLFGVPWKETEIIIAKELAKYTADNYKTVKWVVWELE